MQQRQNEYIQLSGRWSSFENSSRHWSIRKDFPLALSVHLGGLHDPSPSDYFHSTKRASLRHSFRALWLVAPRRSNFTVLKIGRSGQESWNFLLPPMLTSSGGNLEDPHYYSEAGFLHSKTHVTDRVTFEISAVYFLTTFARVKIFPNLSFCTA